MYKIYIQRKDDSKPCDLRYEFASRKVVISNLPKREKLRNELLKELDKDEHMFGPIREFKIIREETRCLAFIIYENRLIHKDVIDYYNSFQPMFHGVILRFETSFKHITATELTYLDPEDYEKRNVVISNVPIEPDNIDRRLYEFLQKTENVFGPIESLDLKRQRDSTETAFVQYTNVNVHKEVIRYYNHVKVDFYGHRLFFEPTSNIRRHLMKYLADKDNDSGLRCNNN